MAKRGGKGIAIPSDITASLSQFLSSYERRCVESGSCVSPSVRRDAQRCIEKGKSLTKLTLIFPENTPGVHLSSSLWPLLQAVRDTRYTHGHELTVWDSSPRDQDIADLCLLLEKRGRTVYPFRKLELLDCRLDVWSLGRLGRAGKLSFLTSLCLDYTPVGEEGVRALLSGLEGDNHVLSLSLCYCSLGPSSGTLLGALVSTTAVRDLYVNGNDLQCEGAEELVTVLVEYEDRMALEKPTDTAMSSPPRSRTPSSQGKKKKRKGKKRKSVTRPPEIAPWLEKLHLSDNGIDTFSPGRTVTAMTFTLTLCSLIKISTHLAELDLSENHIGDENGELLLEALQERKEGKMAMLKVLVSTQMSAGTFAAILKFSKKLKSVKKKKKAKN
ncbi:hypothetical protein COCON_G00190320 [Conger conger]|uniref:Uncharacterized protein n=1 Tax=Conger conger TaxID=82655 RepID=A0A9Q1HS20_CONCO|nr:uncharacterized protein LOC133107226 [Conger conger]KAJ8256880.1 hypothetical protein COCON_G00190320 [Conger conger]